MILEAYRKKKTYLLLGENIILLDDPKIQELNEIKQKEKLDRSFGKESMAFSEAFRLENEYGDGQIKLEKDSSLKEETEMTFKGDKVFSYVFENVDFQKENVIRISFTNNIDYTKIIFEQTVTFIS